jgi:hypothetical protein
MFDKFGSSDPTGLPGSSPEYSLPVGRNARCAACAEARNPKHEARNKFKIQRRNDGNADSELDGFAVLNFFIFVFGIYFVLRASDFVLPVAL